MSWTEDYTCAHCDRRSGQNGHWDGTHWTCRPADIALKQRWDMSEADWLKEPGSLV